MKRKWNIKKETKEKWKKNCEMKLILYRIILCRANFFLSLFFHFFYLQISCNIFFLFIQTLMESQSYFSNLPWRQWKQQLVRIGKQFARLLFNSEHFSAACSCFLWVYPLYTIHPVLIIVTVCVYHALKTMTFHYSPSMYTNQKHCFHSVFSALVAKLHRWRKIPVCGAPPIKIPTSMTCYRLQRNKCASIISAKSKNAVPFYKWCNSIRHSSRSNVYPHYRAHAVRVCSYVSEYFGDKFFYARPLR